MRFKSTIQVMGGKFTDTEFEGRIYDSTTVFTKTALNTSNDNAFGEAGSEYKWGDHTNYSKISHLPVPFTAECEFEQVTNGKSVTTILIDLKPVAANQPVKA